MNLKEHKMEFSIIYILISMIIGVILWFILEKLNYVNSKEVSILISMSLIIGLIIYATHGKGLLPDPAGLSLDNLDGKFKSFTYSREKIKTKSFKRSLINHTSEENKSENKIPIKYLPFNYTRKRYRN